MSLSEAEGDLSAASAGMEEPGTMSLDSIKEENGNVQPLYPSSPPLEDTQKGDATRSTDRDSKLSQHSTSRTTTPEWELTMGEVTQVGIDISYGDYHDADVVNEVNLQKYKQNLEAMELVPAGRSRYKLEWRAAAEKGSRETSAVWVAWCG